MSKMRITDNGGEESPWPDLDMDQFRADKAKENEYNYYTSIAQPVAAAPGVRPPIIPVVAPIPVAAPVPVPVAPAPVAPAPVPAPIPVKPPEPTPAELEEAEMMRSAFAFIDGE